MAGGSLGRGRGRTATLAGWLAGGQVFAHLGHGPQDRLGQFFDDVEFADLVGHVAEHRPQRLGIQGRAIGGDAVQRQAAQPQGHPEAVEERRDVLVIGIVIEHLVQEPFEGAVVDDGQDAKRAVVQLVDRDVAREVSQAPVEIARPHLPGRLFPPGLHPVLDGGEGDKHPVIAPQMPTGGLIGQAVLHDESHGQGNDAMGVVGFGQTRIRTCPR